MKILLQLFLVVLINPVCSTGQVNNLGNFRMHVGSNVALFGNLSNNGNFTNNSGTLHAVGSQNQIFNGTGTIHVNNFTINKASNSLQLDNVLQVAGILTFTNGRILTDHVDSATEYVEFLNGATYAGASDVSHIDGVVRKTGKDAFVFPTGEHSTLRSIGITAPALVTDHFTAYYTHTDPDHLYRRSSIDAGLNHVSACEYWMLNRTGGSSDVAVTLSWDSNSCGVDVLCDLQVSKWDGAQWISAGNGGVTGTASAGTLVSGTNCSVPEVITSFSPFTLGSKSNNNPLPISLISFEATVCGSAVCLTWRTASEVNNDFFTVEKSQDGNDWVTMANIQGAGSSETVLDYNSVDNFPFSGLSYYRLKQTDFNGAFTYSTIEAVRLKNTIHGALTIYPNPSRDVIHIVGLTSNLNTSKFYNATGQEVTSQVTIIHGNEAHLQLNISPLKPGIYHVRTSSGSGSFIKQ